MSEHQEQEQGQEKETRNSYSQEFKKQMMLEYCIYGKTLKKLSEIHNINYRTISQWSSDGKWNLYAKNKKKERNQALLEYSAEAVDQYMELKQLLRNDYMEVNELGIVGWKKIGSFKEKKFLVDCVRSLDDAIKEHLHISSVL